MSYCDCMPVTGKSERGRERKCVCVCERENGRDNESFTTKAI